MPRGPRFQNKASAGRPPTDESYSIKEVKKFLSNTDLDQQINNKPSFTGKQKNPKELLGNKNSQEVTPVNTPMKLTPAQPNIFGEQSPAKVVEETTGKKRRRRANNFMEANKNKIEKMDVNFVLEASEQKVRNLLASGKNEEDSLRQVYCELNNSVPFNFEDHNVGKVLGRRLNEFIYFESQEKYFNW